MKAHCDFCGKDFAPPQEGGPANYMQVTRIELSPTQFQRNIIMENLFMCFSCLESLQSNSSANCRNFRIDTP
jgi:hypothetical protein